jgi:hypothetical protein
LQKQVRDQGRSVFVDAKLVPFQDQWAFLASLQPMSRADLEHAVLRASGGRHPLDVAFTGDDEDNKPWQRPESVSAKIVGPLPAILPLVLANQIFIAKSDLPQSLTNRLIRLAAFQNPDFYKAQAMRMPVWNKPRIIGCAENYSQHIALPRGCVDAVMTLLNDNDIRPEIQDERLSGLHLAVKFTGTLRKDQKAALREMLKHDVGVLSAPTAFGKTVTAAALIARRKVSTLRTSPPYRAVAPMAGAAEWFSGDPQGGLGVIGGGKKKPSGKIDIESCRRFHVGRT